MKTQAFPPPFKGQRDDIPLAMLQSPYAQYVINYNLDTGVPTLRKGDDLYIDEENTGSPGDGFQALVSFGPLVFSPTRLLFGVFNDGTSPTVIKFADLSTAGFVDIAHTYTGGGLGTGYVQTLYFNKYLFFFGTNELATVPQYYNGISSTWGSAGYVWPSSFYPYGGAVFKNRAYFIGQSSTKYVYSELDAITGTTTEVDLGSIISTNADLYAIKSVSLSEGIQQENVLAFIFSSGEVLVYSGAYPNSSNWNLIGRFIIAGSPLFYNSIVDARGDSFIISSIGLISLRTLFTQGAEIATSQAITSPIQNRWKQIAFYYNQIANGNAALIQGVYDLTNDRLIISFPYDIDTDSNPVQGTGLRLIYSFKTQSWVEAKIDVSNIANSPYGIGYLAYLNQEVYYTGANNLVVMKVEARASHYDFGSTPINYRLTTAPLYTENFGSNYTAGIECLYKTDLESSTYYKFIGNLGQTETSPQLLPTQGSSQVQNPYINIGVDANYVQLDISGSAGYPASTLGQEFYAFNLWSVQGGVR